MTLIHLKKEHCSVLLVLEEWALFTTVTKSYLIDPASDRRMHNASCYLPLTSFGLPSPVPKYLSCCLVITYWSLCPPTSPDNATGYSPSFELEGTTYIKDTTGDGDMSTRSGGGKANCSSSGQILCFAKLYFYKPVSLGIVGRLGSRGSALLGETCQKYTRTSLCTSGGIKSELLLVVPG